MKFKNILLGMLICLLSFTGMFFGCKDKYENFKIEMYAGETSINLGINSPNVPNEREVVVLISNAPTEASKNISFEVSKANIVKVEKLVSQNSNLARFKVSALENITSYNPSCVITFKTAEGNKTCTLNVNVEIPITDFKINQEYSPYVVTGGQDYYINTTSLIVFEPSNTTQRDVTYSLKDLSLKDAYGINLSQSGKVSVQNYVAGGVALPSFEVVVQSVQDPTKTKDITVNVFKQITPDDIIIAYDFREQTNNPFNDSENKFTGVKEVEESGYQNSLTYLSQTGITFASNLETKRNADFGIFLQNGLDFSKIKVEFEKTILNNAIVEDDNDVNTNIMLSQYSIYSLNPNVDILVLKLEYFGIEDYEYTISIPIQVLEYPTNLLVNNNQKTSYNIFDYYEGNSRGQEFSINILSASSYDRTFKVAINEDDFNKLEVRYENELLNYNTLTTTVFNSNTSLFVKAKNLTTTLDANITFYSNILNNAEGIVEPELANLTNTINLTLTPGIKTLSYVGDFASKDILYLQTNKSVEETNSLILKYSINTQENDTSLNEYALVDILSGADLVEIIKSPNSNQFVFISKNTTGVVKIKLYSENGLECVEKTIQLYNYYDETKENELFTLNTSSNNLKTIISQENENEPEIKYYLGLSKDQNYATIKVENPQNSTINKAVIQSSNENIIATSVVSQENLTFYLQALKETTEPISITITLTLFNSNDLVNTQTFVTKTLQAINLYTYYPIENIEKKVEKIIVIDGDNLDVDSLEKGLHILDVEKYLNIKKADNNLSTLKVDYIMPSILIKGTESVTGDYEFISEYYDEEETQKKPFDKIVFHAGKNHEFDENGEFAFSFTLRIQDLVGSGEYHSVTLNVVLQKHTKPDGIQVLNENGYIYLTNNQGFGQINAQVYSDTLKEVTNTSLAYEIVSGNSVEVDENGLISIKSSGITEISIKAKASQYVKDGYYSATKSIYVVVADGSKNYPYIYNGSFENGKYYTLDKDIIINAPINKTLDNETSLVVGGINGKFVYADYTNLNNKNVVYDLIYNGEDSIFGAELTTSLQNLNIVLNSTSVNIEGDFGFIATTNKTTISNVNLLISQLNINVANSTQCNIGLMFANNENEGKIENCTVGGKILLNANETLSYNFGGFVGANNGSIISNYNFDKKSQFNNFASTLKISADSKNATIGGAVGVNAGKISNLSAQTTITSNSLIVGGIVGEFKTGTTAVHNLLFKGTAYSNNTNSKVGGIAGVVSTSCEFKLIVTEFVNINKTEFGANLKGAIVGGLFGETIVDTNDADAKIEISYSFVNSLVSFENYFDLSSLNNTSLAGGLIGNAQNTNLTAVYSNVSLGGNNTGALISASNNSNVSDAYTFSTGANALINSGSDNTITNTYSTNCSYTFNEEFNNNDNNYNKNNYATILSNDYFKTANWQLNTNLNEGLPYLVYNNGGNLVNLLTISPKSITASFVTGAQIDASNDNYFYGVDNNVVVINENNENIRAIIYKSNKLSYKVQDLINITTVPSNANIADIIISSSNSSVIAISGYELKILNTGDATISISYLKDFTVNLYFSVVEKISQFSGDFAQEFKVLKNNTKVLNVVTTPSQNIGTYFNFDANATDVKNSIYYNNNLVNNAEIYSNSNIHVFTGLNAFSSSLTIVPYYIVKFNNVEYKVFEYNFKKEINFNVVEGATAIYSNARSLEVVEQEEISFDVVVTSSNPNEILNIEIQNEQANKTFSTSEFDSYTWYGLTINVAKKGNIYTFTLVYGKISPEKLKTDVLYLLKISPDSRSDLFVEVDLLIKSSKLINVELNHYSSTSYYYNDYDKIITPSSMSNSNIVAGNLGVLNINLYPVYASLDKIEVISSVVNGNKINFTQLAYKEVNGAISNMVVTANAGLVTNGISLNLERSVLLENGNFNFNGNLYVSTLLPTNVMEDTIFTITVVCYFNNLMDSVTYNIELTAKPLTSIMLTPVKDSGLNLARGTELEFNVNLINFKEYQTITENDFQLEILNKEILTPSLPGEPFISSVKNIGTSENPNYKLTLKTDILTPSGLEIKITPTFKTVVDGNEVTSYSNSITVKVVDFVVDSINVVNAETGMLDNNLGNVSLLKSQLNVTVSNGDFSSYSDDRNGDRRNELNEIILQIQSLEELISKSSGTFNLITKNNNGNEIYTNIVEGGNYTNFTVDRNNDGYLELKGKSVSTSNLLLKANISYQTGTAQLISNSSTEFRTPFVFNVKTYSSDDNPLPIKTYEDLQNMEEGEDYILLNDLELPSDFTGISTNISSFDGNNKIISINGFNINETNITNLGLFNNVSENTIIKNVTVNILPTLFYANDIYYYGLNINAQNLTELNFGVIAGTNAGAITNCKVINNNVRIVNKQNQYKEVVINVNASESVDLNIAGLVGVNTGFITNSKVGSTSSSNSIKIMANANLAGLVSVNENKIASSYVVNTTLVNNSKTKLTGGFVANNASEASIITSYVEGYVQDRATQKTNASILEGGVMATNYAGGFVHLNEGSIKDSYSNIKVTTNKRSAGFVYDNSNGYVETSFSASTSGIANAQSFRYFTGNNEENIVLNNHGVVNCYYLGTNLEGNDEDEYLEPANGISTTDDANLFEGFISDNSTSSIWVFQKESLPTLYDANLNITSERELIENTNSDTADVYNYIYINNIIGSINNPIIVSTSQDLLNVLTNTNNLYSYYFNGKIIKTNINYKHIQIIKDIDLSSIIDANNNKLNSTSEVQKLQDIIFAGNLNGNGMNISNVTITAKNNVTNYASFGLFKQIGVETTYNAQGKISNTNLDEDNCTVIKNLNFDISNISATITRSVGTLAGEVVNSKLYNININSQNNVLVTGFNMVGAVAGRISGNSFAKGVHTNLSVQATFDNKYSDFTYKTSQSKRIYKNAYDVISDNLNTAVNFAGGLFGVVDIYETIVTNYAQQSDGKSYYINANIVRENKANAENAHIQFVSTTGDIKIQGDVVGGLFGYVGTGARIYDAKFILQNTNTQNLISDYAVGGIAGENNGYITYATVEHEENLQIELDKDNLEYISSSSLFANSNNKALIVGGLVGILKDGILTDSLAKTNINATNSQYVGLAVGQFTNSQMLYVYGVGKVYAQNEVIQSNGLVLQSKGYAGLIGVVTSANENSKIQNSVFVVKNTKKPEDFILAGLVGYNNVEGLEVSGETSSLDLQLTLCYGNSLSSTNSNVTIHNYEYYLNKSSGRFAGYATSDSWSVPEVGDKHTYPELVYNKLSTVTSISDEDGLRNMLNGGSYMLTNDIFLTKPWEPMTFSGTLISAERAEGKEVRGDYYKIYNLNIENQIQSAAFFSYTTNATIENVGFVVGTAYKDYSAEEYNYLPETEFATDTENWQNYQLRGINILNNSLAGQTALSVAVVSATDQYSTFKNITIGSLNPNVKTQITTNLQNVGTIVGKGEHSTIIDCTVNNLVINQNAVKLNETDNLEGKNKQYIGGIIGYGTGIEQFNNNTIKNATINLTGVSADSEYAGFMAGHIAINGSQNSNIDKLNISGDKNKVVIGSVNAQHTANNLYVGGVAGNIIHRTSISGVEIKNTSIEFYSANNLSSVYAGGLFGKAEINNLQNISINSTNKIQITTSSSESGTNHTYVGGVIGYAQGIDADAVISNLISAVEISADARTKSVTAFGGIIGQNGDKNQTSKDIKGVKLNNVISTSYINIKEVESSKVDQNIGGLVGQNWKNSISNSYYIGKAKLTIPSFNNVGALIGNNIGTTDITNSFFIEDLNQISARKTEYGNALSYQNFVNGLVNTDNHFIQVLKEIGASIINANTIAENLDTNLAEYITFNGGELTFTEGSVYNPIKISVDESENLVYSSNDKTLLNASSLDYFLLNSDVKFTAEGENNYIFNEFNANLIGNGKTISINKTFANTISTDALISSVVFKIYADKTADKITVNNIEYITGIEKIVAQTNKGTIFNVVTVGKLFVKLNQNNIAPIANTNEGYILNAITNNDILVQAEQNTTISVSGFVTNNKATIYNSISGGNIEIYAGDYNVMSENTFVKNIAGFAISNEAFITTVVSATTLPVKNIKDEYNYDIKNVNKGITVNNIADYFANGDYKAPNASTKSGAYIEGDDYYINTSNITNKVNNTFVSIWNQSLDTLYGYAYPQLSIYNNSENDFVSKVLSTKENDTYLINNFGVFNYTLDELLNDATTSSINFKQTRTFKGSIASLYRATAESINIEHNKYTYKTKNITKSFTYNGNGFVIKELFATFTENENNIYTGLFYNTQDKNNDIQITIKNLSITDATFNVQKEISSEDTDTSLQANNIYLGAIIAKSVANTTVTGCYIEGSLVIEDAKVPNDKSEVSLIVGGLVGEINKGTVSNCVSNVTINLKDLKYSIAANTNAIKGDSKISYKGFNSIVGGIVGKAGTTENAVTISNNLAFKDILVSTSLSLSLGGIVGELENGILKDNFTISKPAYNGAYLSYYASGDSEANYTYTYNINAIVGKLGTSVTDVSGNLYNPSINFVEDKNLNSPTEVETIFKTLASVYGSETQQTLAQSNTTLVVDNIFLKLGPSQMVEMPNVVTNTDDLDDSTWLKTENGVTTIKLQNDTIYVVNLNALSLVEFDLTNLTSNNLNNTTIIFTNKVVIYAKVDGPIFNTLTNCTITNIEFRSSETITNAVLANSIQNSQLYNISANDIYVSHAGLKDINNASASFGVIVNEAVDSYLNKIDIVKGRLEVNKDASSVDRIGAVVGYAKNTLVQQSTNSATITVYNKKTNTLVAGILGFGDRSSVFMSTNSGLIYLKGDCEYQYAAGIANLNAYSTISFSNNHAKVKGVNKYSYGGVQRNLVSGIGNGGIILYSVNRAQIMSISSANISVSSGISSGNNGIVGSTYVYLSSNEGNIVSNNNIYAITNNTATVAFNIGNGYSDNSTTLSISAQGQFNYNLMSLTAAQTTNPDDKNFAGLFDGNLVNQKCIAGSNDIYAYNAGTDASPRWMICIRAIEEEFELRTEKDENGNDIQTNGKSTYLISTTFELWFWASFGGKDNNVKLEADIDLRGYSWPNFSLGAGVTFDGQNHTIKNLVLTSNKSAGFVNTNNGTIKNINFENPKYEMDIYSEEPIKGGTYYISIISQHNNGTIDNIMVSSTNGEGFITINYHAPGLESNKSEFYVGVASAKNAGTISNVEVICLDAFVINSYIELLGGIFGPSDNIEVYLGGIAGDNTKDVKNCTFIGAISTRVINNTFSAGLDLSKEQTVIDLANKWGMSPQEVSNMINELLFAFFGKVKQFAGKIVGSNSGSVSTCYAPTLNDDEGEDYFLVGETTNGMDSVVFGSEIMQMLATAHIGNSSLASLANFAAAGFGVFKWAKKPAKIIKQIWDAADGLKDFFKAVKASATTIKGSLKSNWVTFILITSYESAQTAHNATSFKHQIYNGYSQANKNTTFTNFAFNDPYVKLFSANFATSTIIYNAFKDYFGSGATFPINTSFLNLSNLKEKPEEDAIKQIYYVYNAQQLAYALTQSNDYSIEFMDTIDMTTRIWDNGLTIAGNHTILSNGFKVVLGNNNVNSLKEKLGDGNWTSDQPNEYGYYDDITENKTETAYKNFEKRFIDAYYFESIEEKEANKENIIVREGDKIICHINNTKQIEVMADALNTYTFGDDLIHVGIDLSGYTFVIDNNLDLNFATDVNIEYNSDTKKEVITSIVERSSNLSSLDGYNYKHAIKDGNTYVGYSQEQINNLSEQEQKTLQLAVQIVYADTTIQYSNMTVEKINDALTTGLIEDKSITNITPQFLIPNFVSEDHQNVPITFTTSGGEIKSFNGSIEGRSMATIDGITKPTITLVKNNSFINAVNADSVISNLIIKPTLSSRNGDSVLDLTYNGTTFGFIANQNLGIIENVDVNISGYSNLTINYDFNINGMYTENTYMEGKNVNGEDIVKQVEAGALIFDIGMLVGINNNTISNCNIITTDSQTNLNISNNITSYQELRKNTVIENNETLYPQKLIIEYNFALFAGSNTDTINNAIVENITLNFNKPTLTNIEDSDICSQEFNIGLITGVSKFDKSNHSKYKLLNGSYSKLNNITINNSYLQTSLSTNFNLGLISAESAISIENCTVLNSSVLNGGYNYLVNKFEPTVYMISVPKVEDKISTSIRVHTLYIPEFKNVLSVVPFAKTITQYAISTPIKITEKVGEETVITWVSYGYVSFDNGTTWVDAQTAGLDELIEINYYFNSIPYDAVNKTYKLTSNTNSNNGYGGYETYNADNFSNANFTEILKGVKPGDSANSWEDVTCMLIKMSEIQKETSFKTNVERTLTDASGNAVTPDSYSDNIMDENNHYFVILDGKDKINSTILLENLYEGSIYHSVDIKDISSLITPRYVVNGTSYEGAEQIVGTPSGDCYAKIDGVEFKVTSNISYKVTQKDNTYTLTVTYSNTLNNIEIEPNTNYASLLSNLNGSNGNLTFKEVVEDGVLGEDIVAEGIHTIYYNKTTADGIDEYKSFDINITFNSLSQ